MTKLTVVPPPTETSRPKVPDPPGLDEDVESAAKAKKWIQRLNSAQRRGRKVTEDFQYASNPDERLRAHRALSVATVRAVELVVAAQIWDMGEIWHLGGENRMAIAEASDRLINTFPEGLRTLIGVAAYNQLELESLKRRDQRQREEAASNPDPLLTYTEIAKLTGISAPTLRNYRADGYMPEPDDLPVNDRPQWRKSTIDTWMANRPGRGRRRPKLSSTTEVTRGHHGRR